MVCSDCVKLEPGESYSPQLGKFRAFGLTLKEGIKNQYPLCCILLFCIDRAYSDGKIRPRYEGSAVRRGVVTREDGSVFVPCCMFHHGEDWQDD